MLSHTAWSVATTINTATWVVALQAWSEAMGRARRSPETIRKRLDDVRHLARRAGGVGPRDLTTEDLEAYIAAQAWKSETARGRLSSLRTFWRWAHGAGLVDVDVAAQLPAIKPAPPRPRPAPPDGVIVALHQAEQRVVLMLRLGNDLGMRRGEVARAAREDAWRDLDGWSLAVHGKGKRERDVPLPEDLARLILAMPPGYLFPGRIDGHLSPRRVGELVGEALPDATTMHQLRHLAGTQWYDATGDIRLVQELLGHASVTTTERYVGVRREKLRATVVTRSAAWNGPHRPAGDARMPA